MPKATLLCVDANVTNRRVFEEMLHRNMTNCAVYTTGSAEEAMELAAQAAPDCAILDVDLPGMSGIELCRRLKANEQTAHFPVLLLTALDAESELRVCGLEAGADDFLSRSCEDVEFLAKIRVLLRIKWAEDELRSVNKRLVDLAGERSAALHEYDERFRLLFSSCSDAVVMFNLEGDNGAGRFIDVNEVACRWMGYSREEMLHLRLRDLIPHDWQSGFQGRLESILKHQQMFFETVLVGKDEHPLPVSVQARLFERDGRRTIIAVVRNMRSFMRSGAHRREMDARYRTLAVQTGQMIYDCYVRTGRIKWGGAVTQVIGYSPEEMDAKNWSEWKQYVHPEDAVQLRGPFREAMEAVGMYQLEYRVRHRSGEYRHVEDLGVVLPGEDGRAYRVLGTIKDITARVRAEMERRRLEQEMQHSQRLESLGVLAGGIAHDFNNILAAIIGLTDLTLQDVAPNTAMHEDLGEVLRAAHRAKDLVQQILAFSRQSGEERDALHLHVLVREALKLLRATLPPTIKIVDSVDVHSGAVYANASQMHQVVMNYCTNAAQAMQGQEGVLEVRVEDVEVGEELAARYTKLHAGSYVKLSVRDTGHGMDERVLSRIFDPFYTTKGPGEGTGMGLAVVHGIITSHGGAVVVNSQIGKGALFETYLPRVQAAEKEGDETPGRIPGGSERLLFVDDEESVLHFAQSLLPRLGYDVAFASDGEEALACFEREPYSFDLIITDQVMPRMTGETLALMARKRRPDMPIILFTGFSEEIREEHLRAMGIWEVVRKPIIARDLAMAIRRVLDVGEDRRRDMPC